MQSNNSITPLEFFKSLDDLQRKLKNEGIYSELEQSFANLALCTIMYNIEYQTTSEAKDEILTAFLEIYIFQYNIVGKPEDCFNENRYIQYEELLRKLQ